MIGLLLIATVLVPAVAQAQGASGHPEPAVRERAVISCVRQVREQNPQSRFDAHVTLRNDILTTSGKDEEQAQFRDCLARLGQSIKADSPKAN